MAYEKEKEEVIKEAERIQAKEIRDEKMKKYREQIRKVKSLRKEVLDDLRFGRKAPNEYLFLTKLPHYDPPPKNIDLEEVELRQKLYIEKEITANQVNDFLKDWKKNQKERKVIENVEELRKFDERKDRIIKDPEEHKRFTEQMKE